MTPATRPLALLAVLALLAASPLSRAAEERGAALQRLDTDQDQRLSRDEAALAPRLAQQFPLIDLDDDAFLDREELRAYAAQRRTLREQAQRSRFALLDQDGDGVIAGTELDGRRRLARRDADQDGRVDFAEFSAPRSRRSRPCHP